MNANIFNPDLYRKKARQAAAEGIVMLENHDEALPLAKGSRIALFGRSQFHYYKSGTGSGGMVNTDYVTGVREAILADRIYQLDSAVEAAYQAWLPSHPFVKGEGWAQEPHFQEEMPLDDVLVQQAAQRCDAAIVILGRTAGEDQDNVAEPGSWLLTETEVAMLEKVCGAFARTIVLINAGNIIDMKWVARYQPSAVLYIWQGGQEGGNAVLDVLTGEVSPSGRLTDTIAADITDYPSTANFGDAHRNIYREDIYVGYRYFETFAPDKVLYPFGYGLSYTTFAVKGLGMDSLDDTRFIFRARVTNTGNTPGKEVVQLYCCAPQGKLGKPVRSLCAYRKTIQLDPGQYQDLKFKVPIREIASYDDSGVTGYKSAWVLEAGEYTFYLGENVRSAVPAGSFTLSGTAVIEKLEEKLAPVTPFERLKPVKKETESFAPTYEQVPVRSGSSAGRNSEEPVEAYAYTGDQGIRLNEVETGEAGWGQFLAQFTDEDLACIVRGEGMNSPKVTAGTAGAFGGVTDRLQKLGIPVACCSDGPGGIRMDSGAIAFSVPEGTCLACTWNNVLVKDLFEWVGLELRRNRIDTLLGPGMNIHRNPLNGRNFEYFSEDPFLTGKMAVMQLRGMRESGVVGTVKHFCCNSQESGRRTQDSVVSERALREIYLHGFELAVKEGAATSIMTAYNLVNGVYASSNHDLLTMILRREWKFGGIVMTDWGADGAEEGEPGSPAHTAPMIRAQNDLVMVTEDAEKNSGNDDTLEKLSCGKLTRGELQRSALNICRFLLDTPAYLRFNGSETEMDGQIL